MCEEGLLVHIGQGLYRAATQKAAEFDPSPLESRYAVLLAAPSLGTAPNSSKCEASRMRAFRSCGIEEASQRGTRGRCRPCLRRSRLRCNPIDLATILGMMPLFPAEYSHLQRRTSMNMNRRRSFALLIGAGILATSGAQAAGVFRVAYAGSMGVVMDRFVGPAFAKANDVEFQGIGQGAYGLARQLEGRLLQADVVVSITPGPIDILIRAGMTGPAVPVASTQMVVAYSQIGRASCRERV